MRDVDGSLCFEPVRQSCIGSAETRRYSIGYPRKIVRTRFPLIHDKNIKTGTATELYRALLTSMPSCDKPFSNSATILLDRHHHFSSRHTIVLLNPLPTNVDNTSASSGCSRSGQKNSFKSNAPVFETGSECCWNECKASSSVLRLCMRNTLSSARNRADTRSSLLTRSTQLATIADEWESLKF